MLGRSLLEARVKLQRFEVPGLAHYSYILSADGKGVVVDPKRDIDTYVQYAEANNLKLTHILETHIHADYASGARELGERTGAELCLSGHDQNEDFTYQFPHHDLMDGQELTVGPMRISALYSPGHTPEHISFVVYDQQRSNETPMAMLSGDFIFVGSLGRPDLLGDAAKQRLAGEQFESVMNRIARLPDGLEVHPAHGAGSLCGSGMSDRPQSTLGYERRVNPFFQDRDKQLFMDHLLGTVPPFPDYYRRMKKVNSAGLPSLGGVPGHALELESFRAGSAQEDAVLVDLRRPEAFGGAHIPGAFNVGQGPIFGLWAPWILPYDRPVYLAGDDSSNYDEAARALVRVGLDNVQGWLKGGMRTWIENGLPQAHVRQMSVEELHKKMAKEKAFVLDVRTTGEFSGGHVDGALHIMAGDVAKRLAEIPRDRTVYIICGSGYRSSIAASILLRAGWQDVVNVVGGMSAWTRGRLPLAA